MNESDKRHLLAAQGWLELGDWQSAKRELANIKLTHRAQPDVLDELWRIYAQAGRWRTAVVAASLAMARAPEKSEGIAYQLAIHACRLKRNDEARHWLEKVGTELQERALLDPRLEPLWMEEFPPP